MSRRPTLPFFIVLLCLGLTFSCKQSQETKKQQTTLHLVAWKTENPAAWDKVLADFEADHPNIRVQREVAPQQSTQFHDLLTQKLRSRDTSVDVFLMDIVWPAEFAKAGWALPLDPYFPQQERQKMFKGPIQAATYDGKLYGIPLYTDSGILFYRKDLLQKYNLQPPTTWMDMLEQIKMILAGENNKALYGFSGQFKQYEGLICNMLEYIHSHGGNIIKPASKEATAAIQFVRDNMVHHAAPKGVLTYQEQESLDLFKSGGAIFHRNWPYAWRIVNSGHAEVAGKVGIAKLPTFKKGLSTATLGGWIVGIHTLSKHPDAAWSLVQHLTSPSVQKYFAVHDSRAPTWRALYKDSDVLAANPHYKEMLDVFETATPRPSTPMYAQVSHILQRYLHAAIASPDSNVSELVMKAQGELDRAVERIQ